jgi:RNAse (barnase) inhibitor barstar
MYALVDDDTDRRLGEFSRTQGFFSAHPEDYIGSMGVPASGYKRLNFKLIDVDLCENIDAELPRGRNAANLVIQVLARDGEPIGEYYIASATLRANQDATSGATNIDVVGLVGWIPHCYAESIWEDWAVAPPAQKGRWAKLPLDHRAAWLEVVGLYRRGSVAKSSNSGGVAEFFIDGRNIEDPASFFCAMGEAIDGPGGYYGWNLTALADCLKGGCGARAPFILHWSEFDVARRSLSAEVELTDDRATYLELIIKTLQTAGVEIRR